MLRLYSVPVPPPLDGVPESRRGQPQFSQAVAFDRGDHRRRHAPAVKNVRQEAGPPLARVVHACDRQLAAHPGEKPCGADVLEARRQRAWRARPLAGSAPSQPCAGPCRGPARSWLGRAAHPAVRQVLAQSLVFTVHRDDDAGGRQILRRLGKPPRHVCRAFPLAAEREGRQHQRGAREKPIPEHQTVYFRPLPFAFALAWGASSLGASSTIGSAGTGASATASSGLIDLRTS